MNRIGIAHALLLLVAVGVLSLASCSTKKADAKAASAVEADEKKAVRVVPAAEVITQIAANATVWAVDPAKRTVTLQNAAGENHVYQCGPEVRNFAQIKVGDTVSATGVERLAIFVRKQGSLPNAAVGASIARAALGEKPGIILSENAEVTDKIAAVDPYAHTVTLSGLSGKPRTFTVNPEVDLMGVRVGDEVVAQYARQLSIQVTAP